MADCPFCQTGISEDLMLHGGHCPACLIEIPGEESPTDPGIHAVDAKAKKKGRSPWLGIGAVGAVVVGALGLWSVNRTPPPVVPTQPNDSHQIPLSAHQDVRYALEVAEKPVSLPGPVVEHVVRNRPATGGQMPAPEAAVDEGSVLPTATTTGIGSAPVDAFSTIGAAPIARGPKGIVLNDPGQIEEMIGTVLDRAAKQFEQCYNQQLKMNSGLRGSWQLNLTITKQGTAAHTQVIPMATQVPALEQCMHRKASGLTFQHMDESIAVTRTFRFGT